MTKDNIIKQRLKLISEREGLIEELTESIRDMLINNLTFEEVEEVIDRLQMANAKNNKTIAKLQ